MDRKALTSKAKVLLQNNAVTSGGYAYIKKHLDERTLNNNLAGSFFFDDRSKGSNTVCIVLAGYKPFLYPYVLPRLYRFVPSNIDVCVVTAGKHVEALRELCADFGWSYLSTKNNNVALAQNIAIVSFPQANMVFKLDEDIFVTEGLFESLQKAYVHACEGNYRPGVVAPILPVNGFGHMIVLERYGLLDEYERRFEKPLFAADPQRMVENSVDVAKFLWGYGGTVPRLDDLAKDARSYALQELPCAIRFSIGAILFERSVWENMGYFEVMHGFVGLGLDERQLCTWCTINSQPVMVSMNAVAGHFSFGSQTEGMREFLDDHPEFFDMPR